MLIFKALGLGLTTPGLPAATFESEDTSDITNSWAGFTGNGSTDRRAQFSCFRAQFFNSYSRQTVRNFDSVS